jgi:hypothetical protein
VPAAPTTTVGNRSCTCEVFLLKFISKLKRKKRVWKIKLQSIVKCLSLLRRKKS